MGYSHIRMQVLELAEPCHLDWLACPDKLSMSFDWDYVPRWLEQKVTFDDQYVFIARNAGFVSKSGNDTDIPAASFSDGKTSGRVVYSDL